MEPARPLCPWDSPGKNTGVDCHALLQGSSGPRDGALVFHLHWQVDSLPLAPWGRAIIGNIPYYQFPWNSLLLPMIVMPVQFQVSHPHTTTFQAG